MFASGMVFLVSLSWGVGFADHCMMNIHIGPTRR